MKINIYEGRKYVKSRNGENYRYGLVIGALIITSVIAFILFGLGICLVIGEPTTNDQNLFFILMVAKGICGIAAFYGSWISSEIFFNILNKF